MCGICGWVIGKDSNTEIDEASFHSMVDALKHRGPDESAIYTIPGVRLGIARLKVIDLETGSQPIFNEDKSVVVVHNGEIVNFIELRKELEKEGHHFYTNTDTEVIVHLYELYGTDCLKYMDGMFTFALWDKKNQTMMIARDYLGIKPLYYFYDNNKFIFSSELRALIIDKHMSRKLDIEALNEYFMLMFIPSPRTIYSEIKKLQPGHYLIWEKGVLKNVKYWKMDDYRGTDFGEEFYKEKIDKLLRDIVKTWLRSDVPLGLFLSGGIDSTLLANYIIRERKELDTFTAVFEERGYDEDRFARQTAEKLGTNHHEIRISQISPSTIQMITEHFDEPFADFSSIPFYLLSKEAKNYITVAITGDGGDEIFAGYPTYIATKLLPYYKRIPPLIRKKILPFIVNRIPTLKTPVSFEYMLKRFLEGAELPWPLAHLSWHGAFSHLDYHNLYNSDILAQISKHPLREDLSVYLEGAENWPFLAKLLYLDQRTLLTDDYLVKVDRMSMAHGLEVRPILLDRKMVEFMHSVPGHYKLRGWVTKWILRRLINEVNPKQKLNSVKRGFSPPMSKWLKTKLKPMCEGLLSDQNLNQDKIFKPKYIRQLFINHLEGKQNNSRRLWSLISFLIWRRKYGYYL